MRRSRTDMKTKDTQEHLQGVRSADPPPKLNRVMDLQPTLGDELTPDPPREVPPAHRELSGLTDGEGLDGCYVVRDRSRRPTKKGGEWLALKLSDCSATLSAKAFDNVPALFDAAVPGTIVRVRARFEASLQWGDALIVEAIRAAAEGEYDAGRLLEVSPIPLERLEGDLRQLLETIRTPDLSACSSRPWR